MNKLTIVSSTICRSRVLTTHSMRSDNFQTAGLRTMICLPMGIKFKLDGQGFLGGSWRVFPLFDCLHGGLTKNRTSAEQLCALHNPVGFDLNFHSHHSADVKALQSVRVFRLHPSD